MRYIGKIWLKEPIKMIKVAEKIGLEDIVVYKTEDVTGTMIWRGGNVLILLHLSWGEMNKTEKIRIFAHHLEEGDEFFKLVKEIFKGMIVEEL